MNPGADTYSGELLHQLVPVLHPYHIEVIDGFAPSAHTAGNRLSPPEQFAIARGRGLALLVPIRQVLQLHAQDAGLDRVQPAVVAFHVVVILLAWPWSRSMRIFCASPASFVVTAPASPQAPRFLPG